MSCFCKITDYFEGSLFLQFYESSSEDMFWPPPPYALSLRRMRGQKMILKVLLAYVSERRDFLHCR